MTRKEQAMADLADTVKGRYGFPNRRNRRRLKALKELRKTGGLTVRQLQLVHLIVNGAPPSE